MKRFSVIIATLLLSIASFAQSKLVSWTHYIQKSDGDVYTVVFTGKIAPGYHTYTLTDEFSATELMDEELTGGEFKGRPYELGKPKEEVDEFGDTVKHYYNRIKIARKIKLTGDNAVYTGTIFTNACTGGACQAEYHDFKVTIKKEEPKPEAVVEEKPEPAAEVKAAEENAIEEETVAGDTLAVAPVEEVVEDGDDEGDSSSKAENNSIWGLILQAIAWGFAMLLTPCVFPMVPMTVSFFMKGSSSIAAGRFKASMYGFFIVLIYTLPIAILILITMMTGGDNVTADIFNWIATHWLPNILFFIIFMVFAASFFGAFEITLPQSIVNKSDKGSDKKGLAGVFFMALTLVLVSFSCTGPIVGMVLIQATSSNAEFWVPIVTMLAFSTAFALPFTILAFSPSLLTKFKKSGGGWLNSVKVVLGFIEIALGLKFLSVADQTYHWGLLDREIYLAIWIAVFTLLGLYLLGKIRFAHDEPVEHLSVPRLTLAIIVFSFVVYLIPGMWGAPLKGLSGYMPPLATQDFIVGGGAGSGSGSSEARAANPLDDLNIVYNYNEGLEKAKAENKPLFIDVTGHGCVNCREMESRVWSDPKVHEIMKNDYIVVALYVDDKVKLDEKDWVTDEKTGKVYKDVGRANSYISRTKWDANAQPTYVLMTADEEVLVPKREYDLDVDGFVKFLESGLEAYKAE